MVRRLLMPRVDPNVDEGTIASWLVEPGQAVEAGQPLVEIITDKATFELEAESGGILRNQCASPRSVVPVGYVLALLSDEADEPLPDVSDDNRAVFAAYRAALLGMGGPQASAPPDGAGPRRTPSGARATPSARRLALREGVDLEALAARCEGLVRREDVEDEIERRKGEAKG